jgi:hypothetical protein
MNLVSAAHQLALIAVLMMQAQVDIDIDAMAKEYRSRAVKAATVVLERIDSSLKEAIKARESDKVKVLRGELTKAKADLAAAKSKPHADYVAEAEAFLRQRKEATEAYAAQQKDREAEERMQAAVEADRLERRRAIQKEAGPVCITGCSIRNNSIGWPELRVSIVNTTNEEVEAFEFEAECFNSFAEPVKDLNGSHVFRGSSQSSLKPNSESNMQWQLSLHRNTAKAVIWVKRVKMRNGDVWSQSREQAKVNSFGMREAFKVD